MDEIIKIHNNSFDIMDLNEEIIESSLTESMNAELARINDAFSAPLIKKLPITEMAGLGAAFAAALPKTAGVVGAVAENGGLFRCVFPTGVTGHLAKSGGEYIGGILKAEGGLAQARWIPVAEGAKDGGTAALVANPEIMLIAVAIIGISMKINEIEKGQEKIIGILERDKKSQLIADYEILQEYLSDYRYYFENEQTVIVNLNQVNNIKRNALKDVKAYQEQIENILNEKISIMKALSATGDIKDIFDRFVHYKLAIYVFSMASYLEVMLAKNFQAKYLEKKTQALIDVATSYSAIYDKCYSKLTDLKKASIGSKAVEGLAWLSKGAGKVIGSIPKVRDGQVDEALIAGGEKLEKFDGKLLQETLDFFEEYKESGVLPVAEHIDTLNMLSNKKTEIITDGNVVYLFAEKSA